ncbi:alkaline phosphatase D family protein [Micromonospora sp. NPDC047074]|uniref:alkaline phosphatase D family protein n=1 Tax=Micromonospora sp. NPDC047074 TaxID=3154339 RepID=UPI0033E96963
MHRPRTRQSLADLSAIDRRRLLLAAGGGAAALAFGLQRPATAASPTTPRLPDHPFTLGVASGDPTHNAVVLWTRLAPQPLAPAGGMPTLRPVPVRWEVATDERFRRVVRDGVAHAHPEYSYSVHVDVRGLRPATEYWYRFSVGGHRTAPARTRTAPAPGSMPAELRFAFASCMNYRAGYFQAMGGIAAEDVDVVFFLGDYVYEYPVEQIFPGRAIPADLPAEVLPETVTLEQYRLRYGLYKSQPEVIAAHQNAPWVMMWDDHEVANDYGTDTEAELLRQAAGYRAFWEHMPLRPPQRPVGPQARLYRRLRYGDLAQFDLLDARQYRSPGLPGGSTADTPERRDPTRSILGFEQEKWFVDGLSRPGPRWHVAPQGVLMAMVNTAASTDAAPRFSTGAWDGYQASQKRIYDAVARAQRKGSLSNFVVLTGDVHCGYVSELPSDLDDPLSAPIGTEFTSLSISSARDFDPAANAARQVRVRVNPQMKWADLHCGYAVGSLTPDAMTITYRGVDRVSTPLDPVYSLSRFVVESGKPRVHPA